MSLQIAAKHLAAHGRGPDTTLVHMTPGEVASLQSLAQQHGGSLSINPQTGLPEAGFLSALLPMAAGAALTTMGIPAGYAALSIGAASAATNGGDMKKAILNGFSAYTGAGLADSFMGAGAAATMGTSAAAPATALEIPAGATSPYALTGSSVTPSTTGYSLGESSSFLNQPLPSLVSTAPAQVAQAAAAATPAAQAAQQAAALDSMSMGQRFDALKAGATGTNAMNYIKANPFTSLGVATAAMTPDENNTPQKAADTDRGPRAKLQYYSGYGTSLPAPNMQGIEQTYNRPYYAAEGGVTRMATGGITSAPRNQQQLFADYLQRVSSSGVAATPPTNKYEWWKSSGTDTPAAAPAETAEEYAARTRANARGSSGGQSQEQRAEQAADNAKPQPMLNGLSRDQFFKLSPEEQNAVRAQADADNPKTAAFLNAVKFAASPVKFLYDKLAPPPAPSEMQKYIDAADAESRTLTRDRAYEAYGNSIEGVTASDAAAAEAQRVANEATEKARMERDIAAATPFSGATSNVRYQYAGKEISAAEAKALVDQGKYPTVVSDATSANEAAARIAAEKGVPYGTSPVPPGVSANQFAANYAAYNNSYAPSVPYQDTRFVEGKESPSSLMYGPNPNLVAATTASIPYSLNYQKPEVAVNPFVNSTSPDGYTDFKANYIKPANAEERAKDLKNIGPYVNQFNLGTMPFAGEGSSYGAPINQYNLGTLAPDALRYSGTGVPDTLSTPTVPGAISAETDDTTLSQFTNALYGNITPPGYVGDATQLAGVGYTGGIPDATGTFAPNMGRASSGVAAGFGGLGSAWRTALGLPVVDGQGNPILTSQGAAQRAYNESPQGEADAMQAEISSLQNRYPSGGRSSDGGDGGGYSGNNSGDNAGWGRRDAGADGGLSTPYGFQHMANGGLSAMANPYDLGSYSDGGRLLRGPGDGVSDSIPATIGKGRPARLADGEFVIPARIVSEIGNGSTEAGARKLYVMMDRIQAGRKKSVGKGKVAVNSRADKYLPA